MAEQHGPGSQMIKLIIALKSKGNVRIQSMSKEYYTAIDYINDVFDVINLRLVKRLGFLSM
ncbi:hypothetical protein [Citrobacter sp. BDA59-3]|uniref:hypothetical protein n=1 Tax=Citrobacter sp. BDA59-3 TaxID=2781952 RepID=UPI0018802EB7|nr:hypothetical protein [Citrobacter sp. BDA59-3]QOV70674.1 hypothetical protein IP582_09935 [Citrobacter sp. BDA59-3]